MKQKAQADRVREAVALRAKLDELGLAAEHPGVARLHDLLNGFARGEGWSGRVALPSVRRVAHVKLSLTSHVESTIVLRATA
jgi:hypothetical protein